VEDNDDDEDGGARGYLVFGGSGGGIEGSVVKGEITGFSDGGICDAHLASLAAAIPDASSSSSLIMVGGLLPNPLI
jgi:hypothetical protein